MFLKSLNSRMPRNNNSWMMHMMQLGQKPFQNDTTLWKCNGYQYCKAFALCTVHGCRDLDRYHNRVSDFCGVPFLICRHSLPIARSALAESTSAKIYSSCPSIQSLQDNKLTLPVWTTESGGPSPSIKPNDVVSFNHRSSHFFRDKGQLTIGPWTRAIS